MKTLKRKTNRKGKKGLRRYQLALDRLLRRVERRLFKAQVKELIQIFNDLGAEAAKTFLSRIPLLDLGDSNAAAKIVLAMDLDRGTKRKVEKALELAAERGFDQVRDAASDTLSIQLDPSGTIKRNVVKELGTRKGLIDIEDGTKKAIIRAIEQGKKEAMTTSEIADLIKREVPKGRFVNAGKKYRAEMIARTETRFAVNKSSMELYRNSNEIEAVIAIDGESDEECAERNGEQYTFAQAEEQDELTHPNCTLRWVPVVAGD